MQNPCLKNTLLNRMNVTWWFYEHYWLIRKIIEYGSIVFFRKVIHFLFFYHMCFVLKPCSHRVSALTLLTWSRTHLWILTLVWGIDADTWCEWCNWNQCSRSVWIGLKGKAYTFENKFLHLVVVYYLCRINQYCDIFASDVKGREFMSFTDWSWSNLIIWLFDFRYLIEKYWE